MPNIHHPDVLQPSYIQFGQLKEMSTFSGEGQIQSYSILQKLTKVLSQQLREVKSLQPSLDGRVVELSRLAMQ
jgi:hypothetical protein